jgi:RHS repeat-associated protein
LDWKAGYKYFDNLGRVKRTRSVAAAGDDYTLTCYDNMGRTAKVTNPFRSYSTQTCSTTTGLDWISASYDAEGRVTAVMTPDSAQVTTAYALAASGSQIGTTVTVTDQASKVRRSITNGLGQLIRVDEPTTSGLGTISSPNQATTYAYDYLNNLTGVTQGSQSRSFAYDALSRLTSATNPESGTIGYTYDANGNLYTKTDARSITTTYTYDTLNRVTARSYSDSTPAVASYYDNVTNGLGKLKKVTSSVSTIEYTGFDILGRVTGHKQTTAGTDYTTTYTYDLAGDLLTETYPSGRVVQNTLASDGSLSQVQSKPSGGSYTNRGSSFVYTPAGAVQSLQLGNGKYENAVFNSRLQPTQIGLGTSTTDTSLLKLEYSYGTTANNGNVLSQTITVPGVTYPLVQTDTYDELNRLASATETSNTSQNWKQEFSYDRYGNRSFVTGSGHTDTLGSCTTMCNPTFSSTTNRITSSGYTFDTSGNITANPSSRSFVYDAENKQTPVTSGGGTLGTYYYDGDGDRVKKTSASDSTVLVYDAAGQLIEEYPTSALTTVATAYVYAGSRLLSTETSSGTTYLTADHLGSPRINTDGGGNVVARHDYMPFGEDIATSQRTSGVGYISDSVRQKFTGYEHDGETGLEFAYARYYGSSQGRFTSTDPFMGSGRTGSPQSWNRYAYVLNNPLRLVDPTGMRDQNPQPPPPPPAAPVIPPVSSDLAGSPLYQQQMELAPRPTVSVTVTQLEAVGDLKLPNGEGYVTGTAARLNVSVTNENGDPMLVFVTESNATRDDINHLNTVENPMAVTTNANGAFEDFVAANSSISPARIGDRREMRAMIEQQRNTDTDVTTTQTLTIPAPGYGYLGTAVYDRRITNMEGGARRPAPVIAADGRTQNNFSVTLSPVKMSYPSH